MSAQNRYDMVIFGATGFTGQYCIEEMVRIADGIRVTWAVAGRTETKLKEAVENAFKNMEKEVKDIPIIIADVNDATSLNEMCAKAKIVLNCVGPYRFYGEPVVKACIENNTHHIDISGEPQFLERMQLEYHQLAQDAHVYVIGACGFDSIPCEMGIQYLREKFPGDLDHVEVYVQFLHGPSGYRVNFGTWQSAIYGYAHGNELKALREKLFPKRLPRSKYAPPQRKTFFYSNEVDGWCLPFPAADKPVVLRTQYHLQEHDKKRPFQVSAYIRMQSLLFTLLTIFGALIFAIFASFNFGRKLLETYPRAFSFGVFSKEGPTRQQIKQSSFTTTIVGIGYEDKLAELSDEHTAPPDTKMVVKVKGPEPGYATTPICMIQCALTLLKEIDDLPSHGGVYTPGGAFLKTSLITRLSKNGLDFVSGDPIKLNAQS